APPHRHCEARSDEAIQGTEGRPRRMDCFVALRAPRNDDPVVASETSREDAMAAPAISNPILDRMKADQPALGMSVRLGRSGDIALIAKTTGHDFLFIDMQH